jgi:hypothetical protein
MEYSVISTLLMKGTLQLVNGRGGQPLAPSGTFVARELGGMASRALRARSGQPAGHAGHRKMSRFMDRKMR